MGVKVVIFVCFGICAFIFAILFADRVWAAEAPDRQGFYLQAQMGSGGGSQTLSIEAFEVYSLRLDGLTQSIAAGYRGELGESGFYLGGRVTANFGSFRGSKSWSRLDGRIGAEIDLTTKTIYSIGVEASAELSPKILGYVGLGVALADMTICGEAHILQYQTSECASGFAFGPYVNAGVSYDVGRNWALGFEAQLFRFRGRDTFGSDSEGFGHINFDAEVDVRETILAVTMTKTF